MQNFGLWIQKMNSIQNVNFLFVTDQVLFVQNYNIGELHLFRHELSNWALDLSFLI